MINNGTPYHNNPYILMTLGERSIILNRISLSLSKVHQKFKEVILEQPLRIEDDYELYKSNSYIVDQMCTTELSSFNFDTGVHVENGKCTIMYDPQFVDLLNENCKIDTYDRLIPEINLGAYGYNMIYVMHVFKDENQYNEYMRDAATKCIEKTTSTIDANFNSEDMLLWCKTHFADHITKEQITHIDSILDPQGDGKLYKEKYEKYTLLEKMLIGCALSLIILSLVLLLAYFS